MNDDSNHETSARQWMPNVYALAEVLHGQRINWKDPGAWGILSKAFGGIKAELLFSPDPEAPTLLDVLGESHLRWMKFATVDDVLDSLGDGVRLLEQQFDLPTLRRVIPFLLPVESARFARPGAAPGSGDSVATFGDSGKLVVGSASFLDPKQGATADCYLVSAMIAIAWARSPLWQQRLADTGFNPPAKPRHAWRFFKAGKRQPPVRVEPDVPIDHTGEPRYACSTNQHEGWPAVIEKAYVMWTQKVTGDPTPAQYALLSNGAFPEVAARQLIGGSKHHQMGDGARKLREAAVARCERGVTTVPTMASTFETALASGNPDAYNPHVTGLVRNHAYAVLGVTPANRPTHVVLRDPHSVDKNDQGRLKDYKLGTWSPDRSIAPRATVALNERGVFAVPLEWMDKFFDSVSWLEPERAG